MDLLRTLSVLLSLSITLLGFTVTIFGQVSPSVDLDYCRNLVLKITNDFLANRSSAEPCSMDDDDNLRSDLDETLHLAVLVPLLNTSDNEWQHGEAMILTALTAQWIINRCSLLKGKVRIDTTFFDSGCNRRTTAEALAQLLQLNPSVKFTGIVGPGCSSGSADIARIVQFYDFSLISYGAEDIELSNRKVYPTFFRTSISGSFFVRTWLEIFKFFNWNRVGLVSGDTRSAGQYLASDFHNRFRARGGVVVFEYNQPKSTFNESYVMNSLVERRARVILMVALPSVTLKVICVAYLRKLIGCQGHRNPFVWFVNSWFWENPFPDSVNVSLRGKSYKCSKKELLEASKGLLSVRSQFFATNWLDQLMETERSTAYVTNWKRDLYEKVAADKKCNMASNAVDSIGHLAYMYDAMWAWAHAYASVHSSSESKNENVSSLSVSELRKQLFLALGDISFNGLSGKISFNGANRRQSTTIVVNVANDSLNLQVIGTAKWNDNNVTFDMNSEAAEVIWGESCPTYSLRDREGFIPPDSEIMDGGGGKVCERTCLITTTVGTLVVVLGMFLLAALVWKRRYKKKIQRRFSAGLTLCSGGEISTEFDARYEIPRNCIVQGIKLGEGAFGEVFQAEALPLEKGSKITQVAMKVLKSTALYQQKVKFISEANVMKRFQHDNVMQLLGVCSQEEPFVVIMELMPYGDLKSFLLKRRHLLDSEFKELLSPTVLTRMVHHIAEGLSYLHSLRYVHRDLAARNCMVGEDYTVKIGDFGMAEDVYSTDYFRLRKDEALPVRWMAPEAIRDGVFTGASDVWSFGVVVWEVMMFGALPYGGWSNAQIIEGIVSGRQSPERPHCCPSLMCELFDMCWVQDPSNRSVPSDLADFIGQHPTMVESCVLGDGSVPANCKENNLNAVEPIIASRFTSVSDDSGEQLKLREVERTSDGCLKSSVVFCNQGTDGAVVADSLSKETAALEMFVAEC